MSVIAFHHHLHQFVFEPPDRIVRNAQLAVQLHRRDAFFALRQQVEGQEPHRQRQFRGTEDGAGRHRGLAVAPIALLQSAGGQ